MFNYKVKSRMLFLPLIKFVEILDWVELIRWARSVFGNKIQFVRRSSLVDQKTVDVATDMLNSLNWFSANKRAAAGDEINLQFSFLFRIENFSSWMKVNFGKSHRSNFETIDKSLDDHVEKLRALLDEIFRLIRRESLENCSTIQTNRSFLLIY